MTEPQPPIGLISNPGSGHNRDRFPAIESRIAQCSNIIHRVTREPSEIESVLREFSAQRISTLAINGGDGTASAILGTLLEHDIFTELPKIILLPGGTANMNAGDIGVRGSLTRAVETFCRWCNDSRSAVRSEYRSLLRVQEETSNTVTYSMFLGAGAVMQGTEYAHSEIHSRGLRDDFSLALGTARTVWGVFRDDPRFNQHVRIGLSIDGEPVREHDTLILAVSTLERLAFGMRPFWGRGAGPIKLTLMEQHCSKFVRTFISIIRGRPNANAVGESGYFSHNASHIRLQMHGSLNLDGEIIHANGPVSINSSPALEFIQL